MSKAEKSAIQPLRAEDFPQWYQEVVKQAQLAETAPVRGCMIIKPWGYGVWEKIQQELNKQIKETGHENVYFPLFIPLSLLEKEAAHVDGFAKECAVVTHHRLEEKEGKLVPAGELEEPLIVRPTSEAIIGVTLKNWVQSHRDLPILLNQWANVVRWEMRPRLFLRTAEFLWQEGHTAHASAQEAKEEALKMLQVYSDFVRDYLAMPHICGEKSALERFPGAENTYCFEMMMQDQKAIQGGTSHYMGQNFAKAFDIKYAHPDGKLENVYTTSWGVTTRLIGSMVMMHADDDGMRMPPRVAPKQIVIIPFLMKEEHREAVLAYCSSLAKRLREQTYFSMPVEVVLDERDLRGGEKNWEWIKKGIPLRLEVGPRDVEAGVVMMARRDRAHRDKKAISPAELLADLTKILDEIQASYYQDAQRKLSENLHVDIEDFETFCAFYTPKNKEKPEIHGGFVKAKWCESNACEEKLNPLGVSIRCLPLEQSATEGNCVICGEKASLDAIFAKSY